eukprot:TRINITY_DN4265_c0_g1_i1.p1 TRINITY_DN4265_c0_g1~~TRINITY_DN4265_c0_g1_i1.p1  ORF type:complete len:492 (+),score=90.50 TRINITY_DN4265_c0_g1_i1:54-1529(+)
MSGRRFRGPRTAASSGGRSSRDDKGYFSDGDNHHQTITIERQPRSQSAANPPPITFPTFFYPTGLNESNHTKSNALQRHSETHSNQMQAPIMWMLLPVTSQSQMETLLSHYGQSPFQKQQPNVPTQKAIMYDEQKGNDYNSQTSERQHQRSSPGHRNHHGKQPQRHQQRNSRDVHSAPNSPQRNDSRPSSPSYRQRDRFQNTYSNRPQSTSQNQDRQFGNHHKPQSVPQNHPQQFISAHSPRSSPQQHQERRQNQQPQRSRSETPQRRGLSSPSHQQSPLQRSPSHDDKRHTSPSFSNSPNRQHDNPHRRPLNGKDEQPSLMERILSEKSDYPLSEQSRRVQSPSRQESVRSRDNPRSTPQSPNRQSSNRTDNRPFSHHDSNSNREPTLVDRMRREIIQKAASSPTAARNSNIGQSHQPWGRDDRRNSFPPSKRQRDNDFDSNTSHTGRSSYSNSYPRPKERMENGSKSPRDATERPPLTMMEKLILARRG